MFCMVAGDSSQRWAQMACGLEVYLLGDNGVDLMIDESSERSAPLASKAANWLVAKGPKALQRPIIFNQKSFDDFKNLTTRSSDVLVAGYPRCGTSWVHAMVYFLVRSDEEGVLETDPMQTVGGRGPIYCEARSSSRWNVESVANQAEPRLMTTHARPTNWPSVQRAIVVTRDPRDAMVSTFFRVREIADEMRTFENIDGRIGACAQACAAQTLETVYDDFNDDGSASHILSILMDDGDDFDKAEEESVKPNGRFYGDWYTWHSEMLDAAKTRVVKVVTYEDLHANPAAVATGLAKFLQLDSSKQKIDRCIDFAAFSSVRARGDTALRKGVVGDHKIYLTQEHWDAMARKTIKHFHRAEPLASLVQRVARSSPTVVPTKLRGVLLGEGHTPNADDQKSKGEAVGSRASKKGESRRDVADADGAARKATAPVRTPTSQRTVRSSTPSPARTETSTHSTPSSRTTNRGSKTPAIRRASFSANFGKKKPQSMRRSASSTPPSKK